MNKVITKTVKYRGKEISVDDLKEQSQIKVIIECKHGQRTIRWSRRHRQCKKCCAEAGVFNTCKPGRIITWGNKISNAKKGIKATEEHKKALSVAQYQCTEEDWPGYYKKSEIQQIRDSIEYLEFRKSILKRDNYRCQISGLNGYLQVHHIESMNKNLSKALDESNAITLHESIHREFHNTYGNGNNTRKQWNEFVSSKSSIIETGENDG